MQINLETKTHEQEILKKYLEENASEILAEKINNGVKIEKDGKTVLNKKDLDGFMKYACEQARKLAEKGANSACVEDKTVFGWAVHYFEEDEIIGKLFNEDGTEYKIEKPKIEIPKVEVKQVPKKEENKQASLFDLFDLSKAQNKQPEIVEDCHTETSQKHEENDKYYQIYTEQVLRNKNALILTKIGDFYDAYGENAEKIANLLNLTLISKTIGQDKVAFCGFPQHVKDKYVAILQQTSDVVIIEDDEIISLKQTQKDVGINNPTFDKFLLKTISSLLDGKVVLK